MDKDVTPTGTELIRSSNIGCNNMVRRGVTALESARCFTRLVTLGYDRACVSPSDPPSSTTVLPNHTSCFVFFFPLVPTALNCFPLHLNPVAPFLPCARAFVSCPALQISNWLCKEWRTLHEFEIGPELFNLFSCWFSRHKCDVDCCNIFFWATCELQGRGWI